MIFHFRYIDKVNQLRCGHTDKSTTLSFFVLTSTPEIPSNSVERYSLSVPWRWRKGCSILPSHCSRTGSALGWHIHIGTWRRIKQAILILLDTPLKFWMDNQIGIEYDCLSYQERMLSLQFLSLLLFFIIFFLHWFTIPKSVEDSHASTTPMSQGWHAFTIYNPFKRATKRMPSPLN